MGVVEFRRVPAKPVVSVPVGPRPEAGYRSELRAKETEQRSELGESGGKVRGKRELREGIGGSGLAVACSGAVLQRPGRGGERERAE